MKNKTAYHWLVFSERERRGILLFITLNLLIVFAPFIYWNLPFFNDAKKLLRIENIPTGFLHQKSDSAIPRSAIKNAPVSLFYFDPNAASENDWKKLGLNEKTTKTIRRYLEKGGRFKNKEDIRKIYGLSFSLADSIIPYVTIEKKSFNLLENRSYGFQKNQPSLKIEINSADSATFEKLYGIGPALASRIVKYRTKLGGFFTVEQMGEVWGLPDSVFVKLQQRLICNEQNVIKLNINEATYEQLKSHPYFGFSVARALVRYREQHGNFFALEDVQRILSIDEEKYNKIIPYLKLK